VSGRLAVSSAELVARARARIEELSAPELMAMEANPDAEVVIVDIRDPRELARTGRIPGSVHAPRGMVEFWVDPESPYHREVFARPGATYVFHCAAGMRSALTVAALADMGFAAAHLRGGFAEWVEAGGAVERVEAG
jgi:rhodanese-related sulfurtransferase